MNIPASIHPAARPGPSPHAPVSMLKAPNMDATPMPKQITAKKVLISPPGDAPN